MTRVIINPGTGPVRGSRYTKAMANARRWGMQAAKGVAGECTVVQWDGRRPDEGRHGFYVTIVANGITKIYALAMPGVPMVKGCPWDRPRMYVDGNSWLWEYSFPDLEDFEK